MTPPRIAIVGAGPGIGLAVGQRFAREGFCVSMVARVEDVEQLCGALPDAQILAADTADSNALEDVLKLIKAPDVLVYNASRGACGVASRLDLDAFQTDLQVNLVAPLRCAQWGLSAMRQKGHGTLLFTGGGLGMDPKGGEASLSIGKASLRSLALCLAQELEPEGIHAATVTVCGFVQPGPLSAEHVAEAFWTLHVQQRSEWKFELVLRPGLN